MGHAKAIMYENVKTHIHISDEVGYDHLVCGTQNMYRRVIHDRGALCSIISHRNYIQQKLVRMNNESNSSPSLL